MSGTFDGITYSPEYKQFIQKLVAFHEARGTKLETEPRITTKSIDLLALYNTVTARGGYDKVSDEKLAWRKVGELFSLGVTATSAGAS